MHYDLSVESRGSDDELSPKMSENNIYFLLPMKTLPENILHRAHTLPEGGVISPKEFLHLGSRAAVDQAFSRLTKAGNLLRVARGIYTVPVESRFGPRPPAPWKLVETLAMQRGEIVAPHGASAANVLGLTEQNPIREVYLTTGPSRKLTFGRYEVELRHAPRWMMALGQRPAGAAVRALKWLGPLHAERSLATLHKKLPESEWQALLGQRATLPTWMAEAISRQSALG